MTESKFDSIITNGEIIMKTNYPSTKFIVDNLIPEIGLIIFAAPPKTGKSLCMTQLLCCVSGESSHFLGLMSLKKALFFTWLLKILRLDLKQDS